MDRRTVLTVVLAGLLSGCGGSGEPEPASEPVAFEQPFDCPSERIATVTDLHTPGARCDTARAGVGDNLESHHYRVACQTAEGSRPSRVEAVRAVACREDERGAWVDVEVCCPARETVAYVSTPRRMRLNVVAPEVGRYGTASISMEPPPRSTEYRVRIAPESCDVFELHPNPGCEAIGSYEPGETTTFMVRYTPGSTHRRGGVLTIDFVDPTLSDVEVRLSGSVGGDESGWLSVSVE